MVGSTLTFVHPAGELQAQESLSAISKARIESLPRLAASLAVDDSYDTINTAIAPPSNIDVEALADYVPGGDEVFTSQETLLIEISFLIEISQSGHLDIRCSQK